MGAGHRIPLPPLRVQAMPRPFTGGSQYPEEDGALRVPTAGHTGLPVLPIGRKCLRASLYKFSFLQFPLQKEPPNG